MNNIIHKFVFVRLNSIVHKIHLPKYAEILQVKLEIDYIEVFAKHNSCNNDLEERIIEVIPNDTVFYSDLKRIYISSIEINSTIYHIFELINELLKSKIIDFIKNKFHYTHILTIDEWTELLKTKDKKQSVIEVLKKHGYELRENDINNENFKLAYDILMFNTKEY